MSPLSYGGSSGHLRTYWGSRFKVIWKESMWCMVMIGNPLPQNGELPAAVGGRMLNQVALESVQLFLEQARKSR